MPLNLEMIRRSKYEQAKNEKLGMSWYKFNIYFRLFASIILLFANHTINNKDVELTFITFIFCISFSIWMIYTRQWLAHFKYKGVINYFIIQYGVQICALVVSVVPLLLGNPAPFLKELLLTVTMFLIFFIPEFIYWKKRIHLFDKPTFVSTNENYPKKSVDVENNLVNSEKYIQDVDTNKSEKGIVQKEKKSKTRFCKFCGAQIDAETKKCSGCGKQYFKGIKFTKFSITVSVLSLMIISSIILNVVLIVEMNELMEDKKFYQQKSEDKLTQIYKLNKEIKEKDNILDYFDRHVVFVEDDGTKLYHKYGCNKFKGKSFWAYNTEAAKQKGYIECPKCNKKMGIIESARKAVSY